MNSSPLSIPVELKNVEIKPAPKMAWALVGIPIQQFASIQALLDQLPESANRGRTGPDGKPKLRFLQYVTKESKPWWAARQNEGAILL